jgi:hypothetical protein
VLSVALPERPPISAPRPRRDRLARQPALGLAGVALVVPVALLLGFGLGSAERSLIVLGPVSTFALPVIAMIAFWWEDWPGTMLRAPLAGLADTALVAAGGVLATVAAHALVDGPAFPATMPLAAAVFVAMLQLTLVSEGWPLRRLDRFAGGLAALGAAWAAGAALYLALSRHGAELGAVLVCVGALQVVLYVVLRGWPLRLIASRAARLLTANAVVVAGGCLAYMLLSRAGLRPAAIGAAMGSVVAAGLVVGMLFEGWLESRAAGLIAVAVVAALLYLALTAYAEGSAWTRAEPEEWVAYAGLNAIGAGVILHVAIGRRWPFATNTDNGGPR